MMRSFYAVLLVLFCSMLLACSSKCIGSDNRVNEEATFENDKDTDKGKTENSLREVKSVEKKIEGFISVKGTDHFAMMILTSSGKNKYLLKGSKDLLGQLRSLTGLHLEICGEILDVAKPLKTVAVKDFKLLPDEDNDIALIGRIKGVGRIVEKDKGYEYVLKRVPDEFFKDNEGALIWVSGKRSGKREVAVSRFGVITMKPKGRKLE